VIDLDKQAAIEVLNIIYDNPGSERIDRYAWVVKGCGDKLWSLTNRAKR